MLFAIAVYVIEVLSSQLSVINLESGALNWWCLSLLRVRILWTRKTIYHVRLVMGQIDDILLFIYLIEDCFYAFNDNESNIYLAYRNLLTWVVELSGFRIPNGKKHELSPEKKLMFRKTHSWFNLKFSKNSYTSKIHKTSPIVSPACCTVCPTSVNVWPTRFLTLPIKL